MRKGYRVFLADEEVGLDPVGAHMFTRCQAGERTFMRTNDMKLETFETFVVKLACGFASLVLLLMLMGLMLVAGFAGSTSVQESQPRTFSSPGEATDALVQAAQERG